MAGDDATTLLAMTACSRIPTLALALGVCLASACTGGDDGTNPFDSVGASSGAISDASGEGNGDSAGTGHTTGGEGDAGGDAGTTGASIGDEGPIFDLGAGDGGVNPCPQECFDAIEGQPAGSWLLHFSTGGTFQSPTYVLSQVDVQTGAVTELCELGGPPLEFAAAGFKSATFTRDNRLMASDGAALYEVDPCACSYELRGIYPGATSSIFGIAPDQGNALFGIAASSQELVRIDPDTSAVTVIGPLGIGGFNQHGATWSDQDQKLYVLIDEGDMLYEVDANTGAATIIGALTVSVSTVGVEIHPDTNTLYVCGTSDGKVHQVDTSDASTTPLMTGPPGCTNLGAPWAASGAVCIPAG